MFFAGASVSDTLMNTNAWGNDYNIFGSDFTIEFHYYVTTHVQASFPLMIKGSTQDFVGFFVNTDVSLYTATGAGGGAKRITATAPSNNAWHHVAIVKSGTTFTLYIDGNSQGTSTTTIYSTNSGQYILMGTTSTNNSRFTGYVDMVRITAGVARYTSNFTPPSSAYPTTVEGDSNWNSVVTYMDFEPLTCTETLEDAHTFGKANQFLWRNTLDFPDFLSSACITSIPARVQAYRTQVPSIIDWWYGGDGYISGKVKIGVQGVARMVYCRLRQNDQIIRHTFSASDGSYLFDFLSRSYNYVVSAKDHTNTYNGVEQDDLTPVQRTVTRV